MTSYDLIKWRVKCPVCGHVFNTIRVRDGIMRKTTTCSQCNKRFKIFGNDL